jgi:hypothetical protein
MLFSPIFSNLTLLNLFTFFQFVLSNWHQEPGSINIVGESVKDGNSNNGNFPAHLPVFDGKNYDQWIMKMKVIFR